MTRLHKILIGVLVAQLVLVGVVFFLPKQGQATAAPLLADIKAEEITSLAIQDDKGASIRLVKTSTGWVLPDASDFPAEGSKITPITTKLAALKAGPAVAQNSASFKRLQVADDTYQRKIDIGTSGGASRTLYLGSSAGGRATHARVDGQKDVYVAADVVPSELNADAASWINAQYFDVPQADLVGLNLSNANGEFVFEKNSQGQWTMQGLGSGELLSTNNVSTLLTDATSVRMTRPLGKTDQPDFGMVKPSAVVTLKTKKDNQEKSYTLTIGARDAKDTTYIIKSSESPYYVKVIDYSVKELVERKKEGFLQQPTPAPRPTTTLTPKP